MTDGEAQNKLGEVLRTAREARDVDLALVERDTKIRARYLQALEDGDYAELPGAVYTKGFLRNYALYLGLDPDDLLIKWRDEQELARNQEALVVAPPPTPIAEPSRGLTFTPGIIVAAVLTVDAGSSVWWLAVPNFVMGLGFGLTVSPGVVAAQSSVDWTERGVVTASNIFARSLGSAVGSSRMAP